MQVFGTDIVFARTLSLLFFIATLPVLYVVAKESSNTKIAALTVTLFSLSPFIMWYSNEARLYTLFTFVVCLNHLFFLRFVRSNGHSSKISLLCATILGLFTHYFFVFIPFTQGIFLVSKLLGEVLMIRRL